MTNILFMEKLIKQLMEFGISEKAARAYLSLVEIGKGTAYTIAKQSGIKRPTVYLLIEELRKKGLVIKIPHIKNQVYIAKDPTEFFLDLEIKIDEIKSTIPRLFNKSKKENSIAHLFDGKNEVKDAIKYKINELAGQEMLAFYGVPRKGKNIPEIYYDYAKILENQKTSVRFFAPNDDSLKTFRKKYRSYNHKGIYLSPDEYLPNVSIEVGSDFSKIFLHTSTKVLIIEDRDFSHFMKQIFELLWKLKNKKQNLKSG